VNESEFQDLLEQHNAVIVHFSHHAVMNHSVEFPDDLLHAMAHYHEETRSCCAICPGHSMELPGSVGLIFRPTLDQVLSVLSDDSGSSNISGVEWSAGEPPTIEAILASLQVPRGRYNEWRIRGAKPDGIFVANVSNIGAKKKTRLRCGDDFIEPIACTNITLRSVFDAFPALPICTLKASGLHRVDDNGR
jgi:hypothetical protein